MEAQSCTIYPIVRGIRGFIPFSKSISSKINKIVRLELELTYSEAAVQRVSKYTTGK